MKKNDASYAFLIGKSVVAWGTPLKLLWLYEMISKQKFLIMTRVARSLSPEEERSADIYEFPAWLEQYYEKYGDFDDTDEVVAYAKPEDIGRLKVADDCYLFLQVPLDLDERELKRQFVEILRTHPSRASAQSAKQPKNRGFVFNEFKGLDYKVIEKAALVWIEYEKMKVEKRCGMSPRFMSLAELGIELVVSEAQIASVEDDEKQEQAKNNAMKVAVLRMVHRAEALIANASKGVFPSYEPIEGQNVADIEIATEQLESWYDYLCDVRNEFTKMNRLAGVSTSEDEAAAFD